MDLRSDPREDTQWLQNGLTVDSPSDVLEGLTHHQRWDAAGMFDVLDPPLDLARGLGNILAVFPRQLSRQVISMFVEERSLLGGVRRKGPLEG